MLHSKSSEAIRYLYVNRVKRKVLIAENDPAPLKKHSHIIQKDRSMNEMGVKQSLRDTQEPIAFHNQGWCKASSGCIFLICAQTAAHRKSFTADGDGDRIYSSHTSIVLPRKTWNINTFWINYDCSCICLLYLVLLTNGRFRVRGWVTCS